MCSRNLFEILNTQQNFPFKGKFKCCQDVMNFIKELTVVTKTSNTRCMGPDQFQSLLLVTQVISSGGDCECSPDRVAKSELCAEMFRCLRNSCVQCEENQNQIRRFPGLYESTVLCFKSLLEKLKTDGTHCERLMSEITALRCGLQYFGNFVVGNDENKKLVWSTLQCKENSSLLCCLKFADENVVDYSAMVLYNILNEENISHLTNDSIEFLTLSRLLIDSFIRAKSHWSVLGLERLCQEPSFWLAYSQLSSVERLVVLDITAEQLSRNSLTTAESFVEELASWFEENVLDVVKCIAETEHEKVLEIMRSLSVLSSCSAVPTYQILQRNFKLLEASVNVLKAVHLLGKTSSNVFSPVSSIRIRNDSNEAPENSPAYGFKKDLVRLIGNLCSSNLQNQNLVRELDGIPLLLDCCNMDAKNPYIMQWCTFALHNVMENNPENQSVLAGLTITGELVESPLLRELGFTVGQDDSGKIFLHKA